MVWHHFSSLIRFCADFDVLTVGWEKSKLILKNQYLKIVLFNTSKLFLTHSSCHSSFHIYGYFYWAGCRVKSWITCLKHTRERRVAFCFHRNSIGWLTPTYIHWVYLIEVITCALGHGESHRNSFCGSKTKYSLTGSPCL